MEDDPAHSRIIIHLNLSLFLLPHSFIFTSRSNLKGIACLDKPQENQTGLLLHINIFQLIILAHICTVFTLTSLIGIILDAAADNNYYST